MNAVEKANQPQGKESAARLRLQAAWKAVQPMEREEAVIQLGRCLTLCAPSGMNAEDRGIWMAQAWAVVGDMPALAFSIACDEARRVVDHPSKIVPAIVRFSEPLASNIRRRYESEVRLWENRNAPRLNRDPAAARRERQEVGALVSNLVRQMQRKAANHG